MRSFSIIKTEFCCGMNTNDELLALGFFHNCVASARENGLYSPTDNVRVNMYALENSS